MTMRGWAAALAVSAAAGPAMGTGAANAAPIVAGTYYEETADTECVSQICVLEFAAVPAGRALRITSASCFAQLTQPPPRLDLGRFVSSASIVARPQHLPMLPAGGAGSLNAFASTDHVNFLLAGGVKPGISLFTNQGSLIILSCTIVGTLA